MCTSQRDLPRRSVRDRANRWVAWRQLPALAEPLASVSLLNPRYPWMSPLNLGGQVSANSARWRHHCQAESIWIIASHAKDAARPLTPPSDCSRGHRLFPLSSQ